MLWFSEAQRWKRFSLLLVHMYQTWGLDRVGLNFNLRNLLRFINGESKSWYQCKVADGLDYGWYWQRTKRRRRRKNQIRKEITDSLKAAGARSK